jgi:hypothetical protein
VFQRDEEILIQLLLFAASLMLQPLALRNRIVLLGVGRRDFLAVDAALEDFNRCRVVRRQLGECASSAKTCLDGISNSNINMLASAKQVAEDF